MNDPQDKEDAQPRQRRRRYLAILFSDLSHSVSIASAMEAEHYADLLSRLRRTFENVVLKHGGTIIELRGDGVLASFGHPQAREDDGRRATEAALELHDRVRGMQSDVPLPRSTPLRLHTGIHAGLVLVDEGDSIPGQPGLLGSAVNIAARISDTAGSDEILVSKETLGAESNFFHTGDSRTLRLQGIDAPVIVYPILGRAPVGTRFEARTKRGLTPFNGRQTELQILRAGLQDVVAGKPANLAIVAPAGSGKTRLAEEFLRCAAAFDCQVHRGYCESYLSAEPLQPFLQMLRSLFGLTEGMSVQQGQEALERTLQAVDSGRIVDRAALVHALSLGAAAAGKSEKRPLPSQTIETIGRLFDVLATRKPQVLFIDDWQWSDDATRQTLGAITSLDQRPILVVAATREFAPGELGMSGARIVELAPLAVGEAEHTIRQLLPQADPFVVNQIREYSGGNPLYIEELCHSAAHDSTNRRAVRVQGGVAWLDKLIESRVERLPPEQAQLVRAASVIGNVIPLPLLERVTGCGQDHPVVLALAEQDLIFPGEQQGTLRFKHGIARDVIYKAVGLHQRNAMHMQIAESLRQHGPGGGEEEPYELLAYHYGASGRAAEAARYAELAGDKAMAASALDRAQIQYRAALAALDQEQADSTYERWMQVAQRLALCCVFDPSRDQLEILQRAVELATTRNDRSTMARAEYWVGYITYALGESGTATSHLETAQALAREVGDAPLVAQIRAVLGQASAAAGDYDRSLALLDEAIDAKRARTSAPTYRKSGRPAVGLAYSLACKAAVLGDRGRFDEAHASFEEALAGVDRAEHQVEGSILCWRSAVYLWQGRWDEGQETAAKAQRIAERVKSLYLYAMGVSLGGYAVWKTSGSAASMQAIQDATSWLEGYDKALFTSLNHGWLAECLVSQARWKQARRHAARAILRSRRHDRIGEAMAYRAMAVAAAAGHGHRPAEQYVTLAMQSARARGSPHEIAVTQLCEAEIRQASGEREQAAALLDKAEATFEALAMAWHRNEADRLRRSFQM
jgi:class 3 adenylate cyclase/tetratricopeptide (TPR) repeat protein